MALLLGHTITMGLPATNRLRSMEEAAASGGVTNKSSPSSSSSSSMTTSPSSSTTVTSVAGASGVKMDGTPSQPDPDTIKMFVGQVPRTYNELQCRELFEQYGPVYQLNILRDKQTQQSKGCCFVTYYHRKGAMAAQSDLHNIRTLPTMHHPIQMKPADSENRNERKLFVGMISKKLNEEDIKALFVQFGHIEDCTVLRDNDGRSKGCAFVTFAARANAQTAIKHMHHSQIMEGCSTQIVVKFADTQKDKETKTTGTTSNGSSANGKATSASPPLATSGASAAAANQLLQQGNLLSLLLQNPQALAGVAGAAGAGAQHNVLSLLGNVLTGLGRLTEAQQQQQQQSAVSVSAAGQPTVVSSAGAPGHTVAAQSHTTTADRSMDPAVNPALVSGLQQQQQLMVAAQQQQQQKLLEYSLMMQAAAAQQQEKYGADSALLHHQQQQQQVAAALLQQQMQAAAAGSTSPTSNLALYQGSSPKDAGLFAAQQQQLMGLQASAGVYDPYASQLQALGLGLVPQVNLAQTAVGAAAPLVGNGQSKGPEGCNLFIYHLPQDFTDTDLYSTFSPFGTVLSAKVFIDKQTNLSKCFGFVSYDNSNSAANAISGMNGFAIGSKRLKVQLKNARSHPYAHLGV